MDGIFSLSELAKPDVFYYNEKSCMPPPDSFVISRTVRGEPLSLYGDSIIDLSPYSNDQSLRKSKINFSKYIDVTYQGEARWLWFIQYRFATGRNGNNVGVFSLFRRLMAFIRPLCNFAQQEVPSVTATKVLSTPKLLSRFCQQYSEPCDFHSLAQTMLRLYQNLGPNITGFNTALTDELSTFLSEKSNEYEKLSKQHAVIPPRLYQSMLNQSWAIITEYETNKVSLSAIIKYMVDELPARDDSRNSTRRMADFLVKLQEIELTELAEKYQWEGKKKNVQTYITNIMGVCKNLIHFYSGMRDNEVRALNFHCLMKDTVNNRPRARLLGNTTKYIGNKKEAKWVTTHELERVIKLLQSIIKPIATVLAVGTNKRIKRGEIPCPLFLSTHFINDLSHRKRHPNGLPLDQSCNISNNSLYDHTEFIILTEDMAFLEKLDSERDWDQSEFAVGNVFPYKTHQFRRSLAVYSAQSGLVSIGSLQTQLKHLAQEITFYYRNNAENAEGVFDKSDPEHMANQYARDKPEADFMAYTWDILFSEEELYGINGHHIERTNKGNTPENRKIIFQNRKKTIREFRNGERAYSDTALGGCETIIPCDQKLTHSMTACITCHKADIKLSKVDRTIKTMTHYVDSLPPNSIEYRTEREELDVLVQFSATMKEKK
jgi:integrase